MGIPVLIIGNSGTGKSYAIRNMDPATTGLINVARKPLPFRTKFNSLESDNYATIGKTLEKAKASSIIIDDCQYLMANEFMRRAKEAGYQKFADIGLNFWNLVQQVVNMPANRIVYFLGHSEVDQFGNTKFKTIGKMLDEKITVEGMFTIVLRTHVQDGVFSLSTVNDGADTVKAPPEMFAGPSIPNDLLLVDTAIREYYGLTAEVADAKSLV